MKRIIFLLILALVVVGGCKTIKPASESNPDIVVVPLPAPDPEPPGINYSDPSTWLLGYFNPDRLKTEPHSTWFMKNYDDYEFKSEVVNQLLDINKNGISIKIILGTWCPDSRREVPRFMRILNIWQFPVSEITFIGVDEAKLSPVGEYAKLEIQRVPTFIFYKNNNEAGRIIENPATSLEQDILNILTKNE